MMLGLFDLSTSTILIWIDIFGHIPTKFINARSFLPIFADQMFVLLVTECK